MQTINRFILFIIICVCAAFDVVAQEPSVSIVAPSQTIVGRKFNVTIRVLNAQVNAPAAPQIKGCNCIYGPGVSTMQSVQFINGTQTSTMRVDYSFTYIAEKAGKVTIPSVTINAGGKTLTSNKPNLEILPPDKAPQGQQGQQGQQDPRYYQRGDDQRQQSSTKVSPSDLIVKVFLSKSSVYEQEPVIATMKLYTKHNINSFTAKVLPKFEGFLSEELQVNEQPKIENYNGQNYMSVVLKKCILYPQKAGTLTINSGTYDVTLELYEDVSFGFAVTRRAVEQHVTTTSGSISLNVKPLPTPAPAGFNGAVGSFTATTTLKPEKLKTNEPVSLKLKITGSGNLNYLTAPALSVPSGIETLNPQTDINSHFTGSNMSGSYTIDYTLLPQEPGTYSITTGDFAYFDPVSGKYHTIELPTYKINVQQGANSVQTTVQNVIDKSMKDIYHIKASQSADQHKTHHYLMQSTLYWLAYALLAAALVVVIVLYRRNIRLKADVQGRRLARANRAANRRLKKVRAYMNSHQNDKFYAELTQALWGYLSDKLAIPASQLLRDNVAEKLSEYGASAESIDNIIDILDRCEMARFTPDHSDSEVNDLYNNAVAAIKSIENVKR